MRLFFSLVFALLAAQHSNAQPNITKVEWYLDNDPGYGNAMAISITPGQDLASLSLLADITNITVGLHIISVRGMDANGAWSLDNRWIFSKSPTPVPIRNITQMEYFIDTDPGYGNGIPLAFSSKNDIDTLRAFVNVTGLTSGWHKIFYRGKDAAGAWSLDNTDSFMIASPIAAPEIIVNSVEFVPVCKGLNFKIGYHATGIYNAGNNFIAEISDKDGNFTQPRQIGSVASTNSGLMNCAIGHDAETSSNYKLRVKSTSPFITGPASELNVSVNRYYIGNDTFALVACANNIVNITSLYNPLNSTITYSVSNPTALPIGVYSVFALSSAGCKDTALVRVQQDVATWTGNTNNDWHNASNWNTGRVPGDSTHVIIPAGTSNGCIISSSDASASSVQVLSGAAAVQIINNRKLLITSVCNVFPN